MQMDSERVSAAARSLGTSSNRLVRRALALLSTRAELALLELQEERDRAFLLVSLAAVGACAAGFAWLGVNALVVYALWPTSPLGALAGVTVFHAAVAWYVQRRVKRVLAEAKPFEGTLAEFGKDRTALGLDG
ncbi:MAG: phage holin family protein [Planctomycetes bacterium]|nr:phage holin family protein [Planctomycetota bacterium]